MSGSATDPGDRSSAEIEREVEDTRARLAGTLGEIRDRASPGQLFEQVLDYAKQSGGADFARNLGVSVRDNPMPLLLIGAGIGWLMLSDRREGGTAGAGAGAEHGPRALPAPGGSARPAGGVRVYSPSDADGPSVVQRASEALEGAGSRVGDAASGLGDSVSGAADRVGEAATSAYRATVDAAGSAAESIGSGASAAAQRVAEAGHGARDQLGQLSDGARQGLGWLVREQPLVLGAIGLAVGAAVGALLPGTETEDRLMGDTRDGLAERARVTAEQGFEQAKETAGEHLERAKDRVGGADVSGGADRVGAALGEAARGVREAVRDAAHGTAEQAKGAIDPAGASTGSPPPGQTSQPREASASVPAKPPADPARPGPV
jgi:ElaB/YqjD/DUF883 family membrane-anchored ribosome-binding protein